MQEQNLLATKAPLEAKAPETKEQQEEKEQLIEKVVQIKRTSRTVKGGRVSTVAALVVVGNGDNKAGFSYAKGKTAQAAIKKASQKAVKTMSEFKLAKNTILYERKVKSGATTVFLKPACDGTGIIACRTVKLIFSVLRATDILSKVINSTNPLGVVAATFTALKSFHSPKYFALKRAKTLAQLLTPRNQKLSSE